MGLSRRAFFGASLLVIALPRVVARQSVPRRLSAGEAIALLHRTGFGKHAP